LLPYDTYYQILRSSMNIALPKLPYSIAYIQLYFTAQCFIVRMLLLIQVLTIDISQMKKYSLIMFFRAISY